jgi:1-acyl-sn-glycerol-3-phosphate acyltransferase
VLAPEGTRSKTKRWKSGFYYIALGAGVPILLAYMDYEHKEIGLEELFYPSGDLNADFEKIKVYYSPFKGKYPKNQGKITLQEE